MSDFDMGFRFLYFVILAIVVMAIVAGVVLGAWIF